MTDRTIHIHEDDWGIRNVYPAMAWADARRDIASATEASVRNRAPDGIGWTEMYIIQPPQADFTKVPLELQRLLAALAPLMPRVSRFYATASAGFGAAVRDPYGSYDEDAVCFGFSAACFIKVEPQADLVARIWFEACTSDEAELQALRSALLAIDRLAPAIIADYGSQIAGRIDDAAFLDRYLAHLRGQDA